jgi:hypothetical protein
MKTPVDIKRTTADKQAEKKRWEEPVSADDYPYGLKINLDNETIKKLGLGDLDADEPVMIMAEGFVSSDNVEKRNGKSVRSVSIQISKLAIDQVSEDDATETLYGAKDAD